MSLKADLIAARAVIDRPEKWCKGLVTGKCCAMWAVNEAVPLQSDRRLAVGEALRAQLPNNYNYGWTRGVNVHPVVNFNDAPKTTYDDVMGLYNRAIEVAPDE